VTEKPRIDLSKLARGRLVFAQNCIVCHSSLQPETDFIPGGPANTTTYEAIILRRKQKFGWWVADAKPVTKDQHPGWNPGEWEMKGEPWDHDPGQWLRDPDYQAWARAAVEDPNFWKQNYLSTDMRLPVNYIGTNSCRAMATNALNGHMWEDFSSNTYRKMPSIGTITYFNPFSGQDETYTPRQPSQDAPTGGGGVGFYRPPTLMSIWATAPFLHNNSLGHFNNDPSVHGRLDAYDDAIHKLLYPERRVQSSDYATPAQLAADHGLIWRTPCDTYLRIRGTDIPLYLRRLPMPEWLLGLEDWLNGLGQWKALPTVILLVAGFVILYFSKGRTSQARWWRFWGGASIVVGLVVGFIAYGVSGGFGDLEIGPIPAGTPVDLIANINPDAPPEKLQNAVSVLINGITEIQTRHLDGADKEKILRDKIGPALMEVSKCPDFVMDKGHFYPWFADMTPKDKEDLIELLKTF
jgi:hypothetical protein